MRVLLMAWQGEWGKSGALYKETHGKSLTSWMYLRPLYHLPVRVLGDSPAPSPHNSAAVLNLGVRRMCSVWQGGRTTDLCGRRCDPGS